jgi:putative addiction module killer protein
MIEVRKTEAFAKWIDGLSDIRARARILVRIERLAAGNPGDVKTVGQGITEMLFDYGPGYRVYYKKQGQKVVILLAGGDKRTQGNDIKTALRLLSIYRRASCARPLLPATTLPNICAPQKKWRRTLKLALKRQMEMRLLLPRPLATSPGQKACHKSLAPPGFPAKVFTKHYPENEAQASIPS